MSYATGTFPGFDDADRDRLSGRVSPRALCGAVVLTAGALAAAWMLDGRPGAPLSADPKLGRAVSSPRVEPPPARDLAGDAAAPEAAIMPTIAAPTIAVLKVLAPKVDAPKVYGALLDPALSADFAPVPLDRSAPLGPDFTAPAPPAVVLASAAATAPDTAPAANLPEATDPPAATSPAPADPVGTAASEAAAPLVPAALLVPATPLADAVAPLPAPRPPEFRVPEDGRGPLRAIGRLMARSDRGRTPPEAAPDNRSFFDKLFGPARPPGPVLAYATPEDGALGNGRGLAVPVAPALDRYTAVYDISAHTVTMPDGSRLEAHSGLGSRLDDPRYVHERMRGPTPPHVYDLTPREQLFHGVRALRLNPVGGEGNVFGRNGLLAHTYMLGPNGDSNGCVSFRNYNAFLQAYLNGEVKRLVVVAGRG